MGQSVYSIYLMRFNIHRSAADRMCVEAPSQAKNREEVPCEQASNMSHHAGELMRLDTLSQLVEESKLDKLPWHICRVLLLHRSQVWRTSM
jgi:hypothetical protein